MRTNFLIEIRDNNHSSPEKRFITIMADDEVHARCIGDVAAEAMFEDFHKGREFYVDCVTALE
ncbi:hypothetical protein phiK7B1_057 [Pseudomonas phage phiK7B1]|nr:hypothetical protein phiK7B1_057 [Pseudomonas phage phiK7B1]